MSWDFPNKTQRGSKKIYNEISNNLPHFIKNVCMLIVFNMGFFMCNDKVILYKKEVILPITDYMIPVDFCKK